MVGVGVIFFFPVENVLRSAGWSRYGCIGAIGGGLFLNIRQGKGICRLLATVFSNVDGVLSARIMPTLVL
jgi:hypothetical protein